MDHLGEDGIALGDLAGLIERGGREKQSPRAEPAIGHGLDAEGRAGVVQQGHGLRRLPDNEMVLGGQGQQRDVELAEAAGLGPEQGRGHRREEAFAVGQEVIQGPVAKGLFHHAQVGNLVHVAEVIGGVGGLFEMRCGRGKLAGDHGQPAKFEVGHGGQRMLELARGERCLLQERQGRRRSPLGRQGQPQLQVEPRFRPMVGLPGATPQGSDDVVQERIVGGQRPEQLAAAADGQGRAANDLLRPRRERGWPAGWPRPAGLRRGVDLPCDKSMVGGRWPNGACRRRTCQGGGFFPPMSARIAWN